MADTHGEKRYHHGDLRGALLAAGIEELREKGFEGFTLRSCARRAGVSHGAPAHHFADANALLTAMAALGFRQFLAAQAARKAKAGPSPLHQLRAAGMGYIDFARSDPELFHLVFTSRRVNYDDAELARAADDAFNQLVADVGAVLGRDARQSQDDMVVVSTMWAQVHGAADLLISGRLPLAHMPEAVQEKLLEKMLDGLIGTLA